MRKPLFIMSCLLGLSTAAHGADDARGSLNIRAQVPEVCQLEADTLVVDVQQQRADGFVQEFCNGGDGLHIVASHRPLADDEQATITYDGTKRALDPQGITTVAFRSGARFQQVPVSIDTTRLQNTLAVALTLTAI